MTAAVCDYHDYVPPAIIGARPTTMSLIRHVTMSVSSLRRVVAAFNAPMHSAQLVCFTVTTPGPTMALRVILRYESGPDLSVDVILNGCADVTNGTLGGVYDSGLSPLIEALAAPNS